MKVKQISVFLENKSGRLAKVASTLGDRGINIRALSIADTTDFGILRLIVERSRPGARGAEDRRLHGQRDRDHRGTNPGSPGRAGRGTPHLDGAGINIEYMYAFVGKTLDDAVVVFRVEEIDRAIRMLGEKGVLLLRGEQVYQF